MTPYISALEFGDMLIIPYTLIKCDPELVSLGQPILPISQSFETYLPRIETHICGSFMVVPMTRSIFAVQQNFDLYRELAKWFGEPGYINMDKVRHEPIRRKITSIVPSRDTNGDIGDES